MVSLSPQEVQSLVKLVKFLNKNHSDSTGRVMPQNIDLLDSNGCAIGSLNYTDGDWFFEYGSDD